MMSEDGGVEEAKKQRLEDWGNNHRRFGKITEDESGKSQTI